MSPERRLVAVVLEVADLVASVALDPDGFGIDLHAAHHDDDDRWIGGPHAAFVVGRRVPALRAHQVKGEAPTSGAEIGFAVADIDDGTGMRSPRA